MKTISLPFLLVLIFLLGGCAAKNEPEWVSIFNGENLDGWTIKICNYPAGENYNNTVIVEDGMMRIKYDKYDTFSNEYAHVFYNRKLSHYRLRLEYKFNGERTSGSKDFTELNSGLMFHSQSVESMPIEQEFPVSVEAQFLACENLDTCGRTTMNIASPGTSIVTKEGVLRHEHMTYSNYPARHRDEWVAVEIEVRGSESILHKVDGQVVLSYRAPQLGGPHYFPENFPIDSGTLLKDGYIALQGESHPIDFKNIELMLLDN